MTSLHVICGSPSPPQIKNPGYAYAVWCVRVLQSTLAYSSYSSIRYRSIEKAWDLEFFNQKMLL